MSFVSRIQDLLNFNRNDLVFESIRRMDGVFLPEIYTFWSASVDPSRSVIRNALLSNQQLPPSVMEELVEEAVPGVRELFVEYRKLAPRLGREAITHLQELLADLVPDAKIPTRVIHQSLQGGHTPPEWWIDVSSQGSESSPAIGQAFGILKRFGEKFIRLGVNLSEVDVSELASFSDEELIALEEDLDALLQRNTPFKVAPTLEKNQPTLSRSKWRVGEIPDDLGFRSVLTGIQEDVPLLIYEEEMPSISSYTVYPQAWGDDVWHVLVQDDSSGRTVYEVEVVYDSLTDAFHYTMRGEEVVIPRSEERHTPSRRRRLLSRRTIQERLLREALLPYGIFTTPQLAGHGTIRLQDSPVELQYTLRADGSLYIDFLGQPSHSIGRLSSEESDLSTLLSFIPALEELVSQNEITAIRASTWIFQEHPSLAVRLSKRFSVPVFWSSHSSSVSGSATPEGKTFSTEQFRDVLERWALRGETSLDEVFMVLNDAMTAGATPRSLHNILYDIPCEYISPAPGIPTEIPFREEFEGVIDQLRGLVVEYEHPHLSEPSEPWKDKLFKQDPLVEE